MATGGSIESITLRGRIYSVAADAEAQRKLGGFENEVMANGDGSARLIKTRVPLSINGLVVSLDDNRGDQEFLQELQDLKDFFPIVITYASGKSYGASAQITGEAPGSSQSTTATINLSGPGVMTAQ